MKTRQRSAARIILCGLAAFGSTAIGCDARIDALGSSELELSSRYPNPEVCPDAPTAAMTSNETNLSLRSCSDFPVGTVCAYDVRNADGDYDGWAAYVCGCRDVEPLWENVGSVTDGYACPEDAPLAGAACDSSSPGPCPYYPDQRASCIAGAWTYETTPRFACERLGNVVP